MPPRTVTVTCIRCDHTWPVNLDELTPDQVIFRNGGRVRSEEYRVQCPEDGTWNVFTVEIKEGK